MKLLAKSTVTGGYWAHGRKWPREQAIEVEVTDAEGAKICADENIVAVPIPEPVRGDYKQKAK